MKLLRDLDCRYGQGYLFSRPLEVAAAVDLLVGGGIVVSAATAAPA